MTARDQSTAELVRRAAEAEAAHVPDGGDLWDRTRRRLRHRRRVKVVGAVATVCAVVVVGSVAVTGLGTPPGQVLFDAPAAPSGWTDVAVGRAVISVPPDWQVVDERDAPDGHCHQLPPRTLFIRSAPGYGYWADCDHLPLRQVVQVAALHQQTGELGADEAGETVQLGSVAAWQTVHEPPPRDPVVPDDSPAAPSYDPVADAFAEDSLQPLPTITSWLAPAVSLWMSVPATLDAQDILATVRPADHPDPDAAVLLTRHHDGLAEALVYATVDADGRRHQWHREVDEDLLMRMTYVHGDWPGLTGERFAVIDVADPGGLRVVAGRPDRSGVVVWEESAVSADLTLGSHPQVAWSPDGTAVAWYAPREAPVMGFARWASVDAIASGESPVQIQTVAVAHGPVQADPPMLAWDDIDGEGWVLSMFRGIPAPYDALDAEDSQRYRSWELTFGPGPDGNLRLPDPVRFTDLPITSDDDLRGNQTQPEDDPAPAPSEPETSLLDAETATLQRNRFAENFGSSYDATIAINCESCVPADPVRIELRDQVIVRATLLTADGAPQDITDVLQRHNVVTVDWILDYLEQVTRRGDSEVTARYDARGVPEWVRIDVQDGDAAWTEYRVTDVIGH